MSTQIKSENGVLKEFEISELAPWAEQPRKNFPEARHREMVNSVREHGVIQPLVIRLVKGAPSRGPLPKELAGRARYEIIAGERRWRAATEAGKKTVLCVLRELSDKQALELALVENLDRHDLDVFEEAEGYHGLLGLGYTVAELAERFGKNREFIYARLDLRELGDVERDAVREGGLPIAAARELAKVPAEARERALDEILHPKYSEVPMTQAAAVKYLRLNFVQPAERAAEWAGGMEEIAKQFPEAEVCGYEEGRNRLEYGSGWVAVGEVPKGWELVERLRKPGAEVPCWGDLAEKYGARVCIVPGEAAGDVIRLVERKVVMEGDIATASAGECVFVKPRGEADEREERLAEERRREEEAAMGARRQKEMVGFLQELRTAGVEGLLPEMVRLRIQDGAYVYTYNAIHGTDLNSWVEEDMEVVGKWAAEVVKTGGVKGWLWLQISEELVGRETLPFAETADAAGMKRGDWPGLCGERLIHTSTHEND